MYLDSLDKLLTSLRHQIKKRKKVVIIGLCIIFSLIVALGVIIKTTIKSNNEPQNEEQNNDTQTNPILSKSISERL